MLKPSSLCPNVAIIVIAKLQSLRQWHTNDVIVTDMVKVIEKKCGEGGGFTKWYATEIVNDIEIDEEHLKI